MRITKIELKNWLNYQKLDTGALGDRVFIIGPNAAGKSNLLEVMRFLRDVAQPAGKKPLGGGLQNAVTEMRGGLSKLRFLNARKDTEVRLCITLRSADNVEWVYDLGFKGEGKANNRIAVSREVIVKNGTTLCNRPDDRDTIGPEYNELLSAFIANNWSIERAVERAPSLSRARQRIGELAKAVA